LVWSMVVPPLLRYGGRVPRWGLRVWARQYVECRSRFERALVLRSQGQDSRPFQREPYYRFPLRSGAVRRQKSPVLVIQPPLLFSGTQRCSRTRSPEDADARRQRAGRPVQERRVPIEIRGKRARAESSSCSPCRSSQGATVNDAIMELLLITTRSARLGQPHHRGDPVLRLRQTTRRQSREPISAKLSPT